jgi:hypothetical protein
MNAMRAYAIRPPDAMNATGVSHTPRRDEFDDCDDSNAGNGIVAIIASGRIAYALHRNIIADISAGAPTPPLRISARAALRVRRWRPAPAAMRRCTARRRPALLDTPLPHAIMRLLMPC